MANSFFLDYRSFGTWTELRKKWRDMSPTDPDYLEVRNEFAALNEQVVTALVARAAELRSSLRPFALYGSYTGVEHPTDSDFYHAGKVFKDGATF